MWTNIRTDFKFTEKADFISLDHIINEQIDLIKIDAEGNEFFVLHGARHHINIYRPIIIIEVWKNKKKRDKLTDWCNYNDYNCIWLKGDDFLLVPNEKNI